MAHCTTLFTDVTLRTTAAGQRRVRQRIAGTREGCGRPQHDRLHADAPVREHCGDQVDGDVRDLVALHQLGRGIALCRPDRERGRHLVGFEVGCEVRRSGHPDDEGHEPERRLLDAPGAKVSSAADLLAAYAPRP